MIHADDMHLITKLRRLSRRWWIAGGTPLRWYQNRPADSDIDLFFRDQRDLDVMQHQLERMKEDYSNLNGLWDRTRGRAPMLVSRTHATANAISYDVQVLGNDDSYDIYNVQLIKRRFYDSAEAVLADFDISVCQIVVDHEERVYVGEHFARDVADRRLRFVNITPTSAKRLIKYWVYGFQPDDDTVRRIMDAPDLNLARSDDDY